MYFRSFLLLGFGAAMVAATPALAETPQRNVTVATAASTPAEAPPKAARKPVRKDAAKQARKKEKAEPVRAEPAFAGNNGELRSEAQRVEPDFFQALFGGAPRVQLLPETQALDTALAQREARKKFVVKPDFEPRVVPFSGYERGTIVVDTGNKLLYLVESSKSARRYVIAVGKEGLEFKGTAKVGDKQEWPRWIPTVDMQKREPKKYGQYKDGMPGGPDNPLGARAIYLHQGRLDTHIRIHGTNQPQTIGTASSNGCFRMINEHVMDLYRRVRVGAPVVVL